MSVYFNITVNLELKATTPSDVIRNFLKKMEKKDWNDTDKQYVPFDDIEYLFDTHTDSRDKHLQTFYFQKQNYLQFPNHEKEQEEFYCFHLSKTISDDNFIEAFQFIDWLIQFSRTDGYIGEFHEIDSKEINLLIIKEGKLSVQKVLIN